MGRMHRDGCSLACGSSFSPTPQNESGAPSGGAAFFWRDGSTMPRMNRRTFVKTTTAAATAAASTAMFPWSSRAAQHEIGAVGIQLYTVRKLMKDDFAGTLAKVAGVGYKEVEFA